ncbi:MAG: N-6 DNA methylase [Polyangiaceae bacterium]|nr:N-6 DNA methylase [Polyangiaceae bacterium]
MSARHVLRPGDWASVAARLDEILSAHSGEDPFDEAYKLFVAKLAQEAGEGGTFLRGSVGRALPAALDRWLTTAAARWPGLIEAGVRTRLRPPELARAAALLEGVHLGEGDLIGLDALFEHLVTRAAKGQKGQYFTPRHVVAEVVRMLAPRAGERVVDPACGSGAFLFHTIRLTPRVVVRGFDQDARAVRVARAMLAALGRDVRVIHRVDSLERTPGRGPRQGPLEAVVRGELPRFAGFDVLLTNPPFAGDVGDAFRDTYELARGRRVERDVLFLERCVELLRPGGRFAIVLPHNKLGGERFRFVREWLLRHARVVAVLGLGRHTFLPHTAQKACVVIGVKRPRPITPDPGEAIVFFVSERDGKDARGRLRLRSDGAGVDHDLDEAVEPVRAALEAASGGED